ncbi:MAG: adenylate/guanylate cyclase domain-containing protein [Gammaproteobacteria bacterium]|nr:adenylate/guanylate cyclase domain-containing protein [Gammaproteobacteria bacterium]
MRDAGKPIDFGIGLHIGDVLYGNIGIPSRLEFSVIGPCANEVARLDDLTKTLGVPVLLSRPLAEAIADEHLADLGAHAVKGVSNPLQVFTLTELVEHDSRAQ